MTTEDQTTNTQAPEGEMGVLQSMDQLAFLVGSWFDNNQAQLAQMLNVPDGQSMTVQFEVGAEPEEFILTGDALKGFKAGIIVATNVFGSLPFGRFTTEQLEEMLTSALDTPTAANETPVATEAELAEALATKVDAAPAQ